MRARWPVYVLLASALTFLASLYLQWQVAVPHGAIFEFVTARNYEGWSSEAGVAASLAALVLAGGAAAMLVCPDQLNRLPLTRIALAVLYLAIGGVAVMRAEEKLFAAHDRFRYGYGAYIGIASAVCGLLAAAAIELPTAARRPGRVEALAALPGAGLLASFVLPWATPFGPTRVSAPGMELPVVVLAAGCVCLVAGARLRPGRSLYAAIAIAVLTGAAVNAISPDRVRYGAWMALGFALALIAVNAFAPRAPRPTRFAAHLSLTAAAVLVVALFLPWQRFCSPNGHALGNGLGSCIEATGWASAEAGAVTGVLAIVLILGALLATLRAPTTAEVTLAIATLVAATGATIGRFGGTGWSFGFGAYVGFAAAGVLVLLMLARFRVPKLEPRRVSFRLVPLAATLACFCATALPLWAVLPDRWSRQANVLIGWYAITGLLLTLHLFRRWLDSAAGDSIHDGQLVLLPLALLVLTGLDLVRERDLGMTWGGGILVGLCLFLALLGWKEQHGGLESFRAPEEIWRVDRLPSES